MFNAPILFILLSFVEQPIFGDVAGWFMLFGLIFTLIGGFIYFRWVQKRFHDENKKLSEKLSERTYQVMMQKWELERKNIAITQQNQEIIDSLHYAKNIQLAVLPKPDVMKSCFTDSFVLYKPKDIVSGDFYFLEKIPGMTILAVADCTGHGVAGAFMSMVGSSLLNQIINQEKITDPGEILEHLNEGIVDALRQKESESHGGMDIAICCINNDRSEMKFAGANRPLWRMHGEELNILRPDKLPIGGFRPDEDRNFTTQTMALNKGDCFYLFTDGYADQFGGPEGKKIMTKKFRELVQTMHDSPMKDQQTTLNGYFENWKGKFEQVDDVLVIGCRV